MRLCRSEIEDRLGVDDVVATEEDEDDGDDWDLVQVDDQNRCNMAVNKGDDESKSDLNYSLAKQPPYQNITVDKILLKSGTIDFISALSTFVRHTFPGTTVLLSIYDRFDIYKQLVIKLPHNPYLSQHKQTDRIITSLFVNAHGRSPAKPGHFDTALVIEDLELYKSDGGIAGEFSFYKFLINF